MSDLEPVERENVAEAIQLIREAGYRDKAALLDDKLQDGKIKHDTFADPKTDGEYTGFPFRRINLNPNVTPLRPLSRHDPALVRLAGVLLHEADHALGHGELDAFGDEVAFYKTLNNDFNRFFPPVTPQNPGGTTPQQRAAIEALKQRIEAEAAEQRRRIARRGGTGYGDGYDPDSGNRTTRLEREDLRQFIQDPEAPMGIGERAFPDQPASLVRVQMDRIATGLYAYRECNGHFPSGANAEMVAALTERDHCFFTSAELNDHRQVVDPWGRPYVYHMPGSHYRDDFDLYSLGPCGVDHGGSGDNILCELHRR